MVHTTHEACKSERISSLIFTVFAVAAIVGWFISELVAPTYFETPSTMWIIARLMFGFGAVGAAIAAIVSVGKFMV